MMGAGEIISSERARDDGTDERRGCGTNGSNAMMMKGTRGVCERESTQRLTMRNRIARDAGPADEHKNGKFRGRLKIFRKSVNESFDPTSSRSVGTSGTFWCTRKGAT